MRKLCIMAMITKLDEGMQPAGEHEVQLELLAPKITRQLLHDVCVMYHANRRVGTVRTKSRAEVAGSSKKLYRQKGTGRARAGNRRTPVRVGGGHCFAKRPKDWSYSLPRKAVRSATRMALRLKIESGEVRVFDQIVLPAVKTRHLATLLNASGCGGQTCLIVTSDIDVSLIKCARNIPGVSVIVSKDVNADMIVRHRHVLIAVEALQYHVSRVTTAS